MGLPFMREMMVCSICGFSQQADPNIESGWWCITIGEKRFYVCPRCFGGTYYYCGNCKKFYNVSFSYKCPLCGRKPTEVNLKADKEKIRSTIEKILCDFTICEIEDDDDLQYEIMRMAKAIYNKIRKFEGSEDGEK